ncbi:MAG: metalloregulator ArsR/SmtB family transcription factor [Thermoanaerobaculia bacterium]|nr:metalloregulator ArsR/SmtB family transcription factor [Thermoanaerobaculia bacterium]
MFTYAVFEALSDPNRRTILRLLTAEDLTAGALAAHFEISRPAVSRHLRVLRQAGLVSQRRAGRQRIYRLEPEVLQEAADWLFALASRRILAGEEATEELGRPQDRPARRTSGAPDWKQW